MKRSLEKSRATNLQRHSGIKKSAEELAIHTVQTITRACNASMPRRTEGSGRRKPVYWWTPDIDHLRKECVQSRRKMQRARGKLQEPTLIETYKDARKKLRSTIRQNKNKCWQKLCQSVDNDPWGLPYRIVTKKLVGRTQIPGLSKPSFMEKIVKTLFPLHARRRTRPRTTQQLEIIPFERNDLEEAAKRLQLKKATGPDNIPNEVIKMVIDIYPELLLQTFNRCIEQSIFPRVWKTQRLILLRKGDKPLDQPSSYRPICLLDHIGKLLERMILSRLEGSVEANGGLSPKQFGFRKGRSTVDAVALVVEKAAEVNKGTWKTKGYCALVTLDVSNAFNTARWDRIIDALLAKNIPEYLIRIIESYLNERKLLYDTDDGPAEYEVTAGAAQGSVIGPFLWNIMYDGLLKLELPEDTTIVGFADDAAIVATARTTTNLAIKTNEVLRKASEWMKQNGLQMAAHKTEAVLITDKRKYTVPALTLDDQPISWSKSLRYLGVQIDGSLRYVQHVLKTAEKAAKTTTALSRIMPNVGGPKEMRRKLLNNVVHSQLLYAGEIWGKATNTARTRHILASIQRRSVLRVICAYRTVSEAATLVLGSTPPIDLMLLEKQEVYEKSRSTAQIDRREKAEIKKKAREELLTRWQARWDADSTGRWTHEQIPDIKRWVTRKHGQMNFYLTQAFTGHGKFNEYLKRCKRRDSAKCLLCGADPDDVNHALFECEATLPNRKEVEKDLGETQINKENLISLMLRGNKEWEMISQLITTIMKRKENAERQEHDGTRLPNP